MKKYTKKYTAYKQGFTLVELSIVLVVIGLVVAGIAVGVGMIETAETRKVVGEYHEYVSATAAFKGKYNCTPGDCRHATRIWGTKTGGCPQAETAVTGAATCNGNGSGTFGDSADEEFLFWHHLQNAQMVNIGGGLDSALTGTTSTVSATDPVPGSNIPFSSQRPAAWGVFNLGPVVADADWATITQRDWLILGGDADANNSGRAISTDLAFGLDIKLDDGKPMTGDTRIVWLNDCTNGADGDDIGAEYDLTNSNPAICALLFGGAITDR